MIFREIKAAQDILGSIQKAIDEAGSEKHALELQRFNLQVETLLKDAEAQHDEKVATLKSRHSQAIAKLKSNQLTEVSTLHAKIRELESQLAAYRSRPVATFDNKSGTWIDESTATNYCPKCWGDHKWSPMLETSFYVQCPVCGTHGPTKSEAV